MWGRRSDVVHLVVAWRASGDAVREILAREGVPAMVGPHRDGWTLAWLLSQDDEVVEPRCRRPVDLLDDVARSLNCPGAMCLAGDRGGRRLVVCAGAGLPVLAELPPLRGV